MNTSAQIQRTVDQIDPDDYSTIYTQLARWDDLLSQVVEKHDGSVFRDLYWDSVEEISTAVMKPLLGNSPDWEYALSLCEAYAPSEESQAHTPITNAVAAGVLEERHHNSIEDVPETAYDYLLGVGRHHPIDTAWEDSFAVGWCIDHPELSAIDDLEDELAQEPFFVNGVLRSAWYADQAAALDLTKRAIESEKTIETLIFLEGPDSISNPQGPSRPRYHVPGENYLLADSIGPEIASELNDYIDETGLREAVSHHELLADIN